MSNLDERTLGWKRPRTLDGRRYPLHLREFEPYDTVILAVLAEIEPATYDDIEARLDNPKVAAELSGWVTSAEWRGLVEVDRSTPRRGPWTYSLGPRGGRQRTRVA
jgi:hypothetical protein